MYFLSCEEIKTIIIIIISRGYIKILVQHGMSTQNRNKKISCSITVRKAKDFLQEIRKRYNLLKRTALWLICVIIATTKLIRMFMNFNNHACTDPRVQIKKLIPESVALVTMEL